MVSCPSCQEVVDEIDPLDACSNCGLTLAALDGRCGVIPMIRKRAYSPVGAFSARDRRVLNRWAYRFERIFPQTQLAVVATEVPAKVTAREYGFWLLNRGRFFTAQKTPGRNFCILFLIDTTRQHFAVILGYGIESVLSSEDLASVLAAGLPALRKDLLREGSVAAVRQLIAKLKPVLAAS